jgi:hypothetical protein
MELFVVDHGDSYDRFTIGIARSLDEARAMARSYLASLDRPPSSFDFFGVIRHEAGVVGDSDLMELTLN